MGGFRASSLGAGAIILAFLLLLFHRYGTGLLFLVVGAGLLWYSRMEREAKERAAREREQAEGAPSGDTGAAPETPASESGAAAAGDGGSGPDHPLGESDERRE